jgi:hypothetical protein
MNPKKNWKQKRQERLAVKMQTGYAEYVTYHRCNEQADAGWGLPTPPEPSSTNLMTLDALNVATETKLLLFQFDAPNEEAA